MSVPGSAGAAIMGVSHAVGSTPEYIHSMPVCVTKLSRGVVEVVNSTFGCIIGLTAPTAHGARELTSVRSRRCPLVFASVSSCPSSSLATSFRSDPNRERKGSHRSCSQGRLLFLSWEWEEKKNKMKSEIRPFLLSPSSFFIVI